MRPGGFRRAKLALSPREAAARLAPLGGLIWLDSAAVRPGSVSILTAGPVEIISGRLPHDADKIRAALGRHRTAATSEWPLPAGGLFGWISFDGCFTLGAYPHCLAFSHDAGEWFAWGGLDEALGDGGKIEPPLSSAPLGFQPLVGQDDFIAAVRRAQEYIAAGDIYQVNLAFPWRSHWPREADAFSFYQRLREASPAPFAAFAELDGTRVCSASPELFLQMSGRDIQTRPIKGTRPRFPDDPARDLAAANELLRSDKERAELLMITDLERNDLGQVCEFGSIAVPGLWQIERFAQVFHLVSTVTGRLRPEVDHVAALAACFPGGSISGAPKKRALEIIAELEERPRGIYTGAIGCFGFNGESQWNIAIRTAVQSGGRIEFHAGAGIVADSAPEREYEEALLKASSILRAAG